MKYTVRPATVSDLESIFQLSSEHLETKQVQVDGATIQITFQVLLEQPAYQIMVAINPDERVVGMVTASVSPLVERSQTLVFLENLFVHESARSQQVANQLMDAVIMDTSAEQPLFATSVAESDLAETSRLFVNSGYQKADEQTAAQIIESLRELPLERGLEGNIVYYFMTPQ